MYFVCTHILVLLKKIQMSIEVDSWPYDFPASKDFHSKDQRGNVSGRLLVRDTYDFIHSLPSSDLLTSTSLYIIILMYNAHFYKNSAYLTGTSVELIYLQRVLTWD